MDLLTLATYAAIAFVVVMIVRAVVRALRWEKQEREGAGEWAAENGWGFVSSEPSLVHQWHVYPIRGEGTATQVLTTTLAGQHVSSFWYQQSRSEEHTSELQSRFDIVCRLLLEIKQS